MRELSKSSNIRIPLENYENIENLRIPSEKHKKNENLKFQTGIMRIKKI